ncbi:c-type cytochrome [Dokdonella sp.]|uniref:c-type cytochrome n=1 Tax=Dokdonella sp. TaxID=2291710 RepID=UPI003529C8A6
MIINPDAPSISKAEYAESTQIFFERCAGCHGVLRKGATGKPLTPDITRAKGTDSPQGLDQFWLTRRHAELGNLRRDPYRRAGRHDGALLQHDPPAPPEGMPEMMASWKEIIPADQRLSKKENNYNIDNFFAVTR